MKSPVITAALTLSLTGQYERQGIEAAEGVRLWAQEADIRLILADDHGSRSMAVDTYAGWIDGVDLLLGPYASGLVRAVAPLVRDAERILWNHGGSADDLAQPGTASLPAPASTYFEGIVDEASEHKVRDRSHAMSPTEPSRAGPNEGSTARRLMRPQSRARTWRRRRFWWLDRSSMTSPWFAASATAANPRRCLVP
jgi:hypothetical protein